MVKHLKFLLNLSIKQTLLWGIVFIYAISLSAMLVYQHYENTKLIEDMTLTTTEGIAASVSSAILDPLLTRDYSAISEIADSHLKIEGIISVSILDQNGLVLASSIRQNHQSVVEKKIISVKDVKINSQTLGKVEVVFDQSEYLTQMNNEFLELLVAGIAVLILAVFLAFWLLSSITKRLYELESVMEKFGRGETHVRVKTYSSNEIDRLSNAFNKMASDFNQLQAVTINQAKFAAIGEMASGIAHEINNPIAIINLKATYLQKAIGADKLSPDILDKEIKGIIDTTLRVSKIINSLRLLSRNDQSMEYRWESVASSFSTAYDLIAERLKITGMKVSVQSLEDYEVFGETVLISQVFLNLIANAVDALKDIPGSWIKVETEENGNYLLVKFTDSGPGIPSHLLTKIMEPFFTTKEVGKGTGLGLSISRGIMETHQGHLRYNSSSPNTQFILEFSKYRKISADLKSA